MPVPGFGARLALAGAAMLAGLAIAAATALDDGSDPLAPLVRHVGANPDGKAAASVDMKALEGDRSGLPVGVFDSGVGGLTVMEAILSLDAHDNLTLQPGADGVPDFAGEKFIYLGDQANMPYGNYPSSGRAAFLRELIVKNAVFLLGRRYSAEGATRYDKPPVKAIVIACNTATAYGIDDIRSALGQWKLDIPVVGVVEAGARAVKEARTGTSADGAVAVMATVGTVASEAYPRAIGRVLGLAGRTVPEIVQHGSVGLAGALEGNRAFVGQPPAGGGSNPGYLGPAVGNGKAPIDPSLLEVYGFDPAGLLGRAGEPATWQLNSAPNYVRYDVAMLAENYRRSGGTAPISTVVLGCTHYPMARGEIADAFQRLRGIRLPCGEAPYRALIAPRIEYVDPADFTARELFRELARKKIRADRHSTAEPILEQTFVSVPNPARTGSKRDHSGAFDADYKYGRSPGRPETEDTVCVPLGEARDARQSMDGLSRALPRVSSALGL